MSQPISEHLNLSFSYHDLQPLGFLVVSAILSLYLLYQWALPKPIPGIPYNEDAAHNVLGDIPAYIKENKKKHTTFNQWAHKETLKHNSPITQLFLPQYRKPMVLLFDFREIQDLMMRRKEFDRAETIAMAFSSLIPDHHITKLTNNVFKSHRRLLQDLMSPSFLHDVAAPVIHANCKNLIRLWELKADIAGNRPFSATEDIFHAALDAVLGFAFGAQFKQSAIGPNVKLLVNLGTDGVAKLRGIASGDDAPVVFPEAPYEDAIEATLVSTSLMEELDGWAFYKLRSNYVVWKYPRYANALKKKKNQYIRRELEQAVERMANKDFEVRSAVEHMVERETKLAEKEGRTPQYFGTKMMDETYGFVVAGHDTTSTTVSWAVKILADKPEYQYRLRAELEAALPEVAKANRHPTVEEITGTNIPYLDAVMEEILRYGGTVPFQERQAQCDTQLLGHHIPKGTIVNCMGMGPSMMSPSFDIDESKRTKTGQDARRDGRSREWDPEDIGEFKPERWLVPKAGGDGYEYDSAAGPLLVFGLGPRSCFGKRLAYLEFRILMFMIIWNFELLKCPPELSTYEAIAGITHKATTCYVRLRKVQRGSVRR